MNGEIYSLIKVWIIAVASGCYCYTISRITSKGIPRLISVIPIIIIFTIIPFSISSLNLGGITFFYLAWLANFKLLLFSFDLGPILKISLRHFLCTLLLPINIKVNPDPSDPVKKTGFRRWALFGVKFLTLACVIGLYRYKKSLPYVVVLTIYFFHLFLVFQIIFAISAAFARAFLGLQLAPQFNNPHLSTSLEDLWFKRWNLVVSDILLHTVYNPIYISIVPVIGRKHARLIGIIVFFLVNGLMHELIFYYATRATPTWEVTWFFIMHGLCTATEVVVKDKVSGKWQLHRVISGLLTLGFFGTTLVWLFFPQLYRNKLHEKAIHEYFTMINFFKKIVLQHS